MTTLSDRPNTALIVIDVQDGVVTGVYKRDEVVGNIVSLVEKARDAGVPVIWVQHADEDMASGSDDWQLAVELKPAAGEHRIEKHYGDAFEDTTLEAALSDLGVGKLIVTGAETDACIRSSIHGAFVRGYDTLLVSDAHTATDKSEWGAPPVDKVIAHTNLYWSFHSAPGRSAGTVESAEVDFKS
jgi:nicotinamidase-related amidase